MKTTDLIYTIILLFLMSCLNTENDKDDTNRNTEEQNTTSQTGWNTLGSVIASATENGETNGQTLSSVETQFAEVLKQNPNHPQANLGMAVVSFFKIQHDSDIESYMNDNFRTKQAFNHQYELLLKSPQIMMNRSSDHFNPQFKVSDLQKKIEEQILTKLYKIKDYLEKVEQHTDAAIEISNEEETYKIDLGEIYVFDASIHALISSFEMITLFNVDLLDEDGTYTWVNETQTQSEKLNDILHSYTLDEKRNLAISYTTDYKRAFKDSTLAGILKYNLTHEGSTFLKVRSGKENGKAVLSGLQGIVNKLAAADDFIRNKRTDQSSNMIKLSNLAEIDSEILAGENKPNFAKDWKSLTDVISFMKKLMSEQVDFNEVENGKEINISVNLSQFFTSINDIRPLLPLYKWTEGEWIQKKFHYEYQKDLNGDDYHIWGSDEKIDSVQTLHKKVYGAIIEPLQFVDTDGKVISDDEMPYFNDYTFGGLFPGMTRDTWIQLSEN